VLDLVKKKVLNRNAKEIGNANLHFITGNPFITLIHGIRRFGDPKFLGDFVLGSAPTQFPKFLSDTHSLHILSSEVKQPSSEQAISGRSYLLHGD
jgi:hypothetical protein